MSSTHHININWTRSLLLLAAFFSPALAGCALHLHTHRTEVQHYHDTQPLHLDDPEELLDDLLLHMRDSHVVVCEETPITEYTSPCLLRSDFCRPPGAGFGGGGGVLSPGAYAPGYSLAPLRGS